ncbi:hypothetical protein [Mucilaginibacter sp.]|uniref:hypothetical protein n=1 Tax=Mucilaginibacter sp. TaxID=1882438 RepID=UPI00326757D5
MENPDNKFTLNLSNAAELTSFAIALAALFSIIRNYVYYVLLLHVPIFQYLDLSDIVLIAPSGIFWALYISAMEAVNFIASNEKFSKGEKIFYPVLLYVSIGLLTWIGYYNEPIIEQGMKFLFRNWWLALPLVLYVVIRMKAIDSNKDFFKKNRYAAACILTVWYATFDSYSNYSVLTESSRHLHFVMKMKNGVVVKVNNDIIYAGRTSNYWFLYNNKTNFVRAIKNDDVEIIDFDVATR